MEHPSYQLEKLHQPEEAEPLPKPARRYEPPRVMWDDLFKAMIAPLACAKQGGDSAACDSFPSSA